MSISLFRVTVFAPLALSALLLAAVSHVQAQTNSSTDGMASAPSSGETPAAQKKPAKRGAQSGRAASGVPDIDAPAQAGDSMTGAEKKPARRGAQSGQAPSTPGKQ